MIINYYIIKYNNNFYSLKWSNFVRIRKFHVGLKIFNCIQSDEKN